MPAALDVDWKAVKTHCVAHGIPDAAKRYGITQEAIRQRCHREGWKDDPTIAEALVRAKDVSRFVTSTRKSSAELMVESIKDKLARTRANHVETALIASADMLALAETTPSVFRDPDMAGVLLTTGKHAALAGSWQTQAPAHKIQLAATGNEGITLEAEIVEEASTDISDY